MVCWDTFLHNLCGRALKCVQYEQFCFCTPPYRPTTPSVCVCMTSYCMVWPSYHACHRCASTVQLIHCVNLPFPCSDSVNGKRNLVLREQPCAILIHQDRWTWTKKEWTRVSFVHSGCKWKKIRRQTVVIWVFELRIGLSSCFVFCFVTAVKIKKNENREAGGLRCSTVSSVLSNAVYDLSHTCDQNVLPIDLPTNGTYRVFVIYIQIDVYDKSSQTLYHWVLNKSVIC